MKDTEHQNFSQKCFDFLSDSGLSDHRAGMVIAKNGRFYDRLREGKRFWPETKDQVLGRIKLERDRRGLDV